MHEIYVRLVEPYAVAWFVDTAFGRQFQRR